LYSCELSLSEEKVLIQKILHQSAQGLPPQYAFVKNMANIILKRKNPPTPQTVGTNWVTKFVKRHPELQSVFNRKFDYQRAECKDPELIGLWFKLVKDTDAKKLAHLLQKTPMVVDSPDASPLAVSAGHVEFKNVCFSHTDGSHTLTDISFEAEPCQLVALVGSSGSGKSTIATLLVRGYDVRRGEIRIDGHDISKVTLESLREAPSAVQSHYRLQRGLRSSNK